MTKATSRWVLALLWSNLAVAIVILVGSATGQFPTLRDLARAAITALIYANVAGLLGTVLMSDLVNRMARRGRSLRVLLPASIGVVTAIVGLPAQALLVSAGFSRAADFWPAYLDNLRTAVPLALMFGLGAFFHASMQAKVAAIEHQLRERQLAEDRARKAAAEARLRSLEARIHPHFLFNTLNAISALIPVNPEHAEQLVGRLAALLRASLDSGRHPLIPLNEELEMVASYLAIEKARFGDKLHCSIEVQAGAQDRRVPPMAVQSLVENAVKHGIMARGQGAVRVDATLDDTGLRVKVCDTGPGFDLTAVPGGRGLDNLVERLQALFGNAAGLQVFRQDGQTVVELELPST